MSERITFRDIHTLLHDLGFERARVEGQPYVLFRHTTSDVLFLFRPHRTNERVDGANLDAVRVHLVENGFLDSDEFERELKQRGEARRAGAQRK